MFDLSIIDNNPLLTQAIGPHIQATDRILHNGRIFLHEKVVFRKSLNLKNENVWEPDNSEAFEKRISSFFAF